MKPHRLTLTNQLVGAYGLFDYMDVFQPRDATHDELVAFHDADYVDFLERSAPPPGEDDGELMTCQGHAGERAILLGQPGALQRRRRLPYL